MNSKLTLQINNLEALERLIGGDTEVEMDIRRSVVDAFAEKYLKPMAAERMKGVVDELIAPARMGFEAELSKYFTTHKEYGSVTIRLTGSHQKAFTEQAKAIIMAATDEAIKEAVTNAKEVIDQRISAAIKQIDEHINWSTSEDRFRYMVNEVAQKKIQAIVGKIQ